MLDFDAGKFIIIAIVALIVIGPKELPRVMRQAGQAAAKMRRMAAEFRGQFMDAMREADIDDIKADVAKLAESAKADAGIDPLAQIKAELTQALREQARRAVPGREPRVLHDTGRPFGRDGAGMSVSTIDLNVDAGESFGAALYDFDNDGYKDSD
jgi:Tat protein translocase TatB subunit